MSGGAAFVGREAELARLGNWVDDLISGTGRAVLIEGEPGIGKSSVVRAAAQAAARRGCQVYWAAADELGQALPLRPLLNALRARPFGEEPRLATILRLLRGELTGVVDTTTAASEQMITLLNELCAAAPTVLIVDDMHWADGATVGVWEWLARSADRAPLLLVGTTRPVPLRNELRTVRRVVDEEGIIHLGGLSPEAVAAMIAAIANGKPGEELLRLADGAAGNPLYLNELMDALIRAGRITVTTWGTVEVTGGSVPDSLVAAIAHRLDLPREIRTVLQAAALLGVDFLVSDLAIVLQRRVAELVPAIDEARAAGVLRDVGSRLCFRHPLIRTALYDDIAVSVRAAWHWDAAKTLAEAGVPVSRVARQLLRAIELPGSGPLDQPMLRWVVDAAPALVAQAPQAAIELFRQASRRSTVTSAQGAVLASRLADALYRTGDCAEAERVAIRAMRALTDPDELIDLHWTLSQCQSVLGRSAESLDTLAKALASPALALRHRARLLVLTARAHRNLGEVVIAGQVAAEALELAERAVDRWAIGWSLHVLTIVSIMRGDTPASLPLFDRALEVVGDDPELIDLGLLLRINRSVALGDLDRYPEAIAAAEAVRQLADETGSLVRFAQAQSALGELLFDVGRWDDAVAEVEVLADEFKDPGATCCDRGTAAVIALHRGEVEVGRKHLRLAESSAEKIGNRVVASLALARSLEHEIRGDRGSALGVLMAGVTNQAEELDELEDLLPEAVRLAVGHAGSAAVAREVSELAAGLARRSRAPHRMASAAYCEGLLSGDPKLLLEAAERYGEAERPLARAKALEAAALGFAGRGEHGPARQAFLAADDLYDGLGAQWDIGRLRALLREHGIRRGPRGRRRKPGAGWDSLTAREARIAELVAEGLSNRAIAEQLRISTRTIDTHVSHILAKLGVRSRVDIAREVGGRAG